MCWSTARRSPPSTRPAASTAPADDQIVDATGKYVIPGAIDAHTHMQLPFGGTFASDTFETGTRAAAFGGTTTIIDFAVQRTGEVVQDGLAAWHAKADGECFIDYAFHMILGGVDEDALKAMDQLVADEGITSFKLFMAYPGVFYSDDGQILRAMQRARENGAMIMMHAENGTGDRRAGPAGAGPRRDRSDLPRPDPAAGAGGGGHQPGDLAGRRWPATARSTSCTCRRRRRSTAVAEARDAGRNVFAETCPQYLYLTLEDQLGAPGFEGAKWVCSTPLRSKHEPPPRATCGRVCGPTIWPSCPPTTARSA